MMFAFFSNSYQQYQLKNIIRLIFSCFFLLRSNGYVYYPFAPSALYQEGMNVSFVSGRFSFYQEQAGYGSNGVYNGVLGLSFDRTEKYVVLSSADGKKIRKLNFRTTYVGIDITRK